MAFVPAGTVSGGVSYHYKYAIGHKKQTAANTDRPQQPVFTVWEILFFVWLAVTITTIALICKGII